MPIQNMRVQAMPLSRPVRTIGTRVRLFPGVDHVVLSEVILIIELPETDGAGVVLVRQFRRKVVKG